MVLSFHLKFITQGLIIQINLNIVKKLNTEFNLLLTGEFRLRLNERACMKYLYYVLNMILLSYDKYKEHIYYKIHFIGYFAYYTNHLIQVD